MTQAKRRPATCKPDFDVDGILRFAAQNTSAPAHESASTAGNPDRPILSLRLKAEVIAKLTAEAARKEKTVEQIIEKLVSKHLNKH